MNRLSRRTALLGAAAILAASGTDATPKLGEDGLLREPWFLESFLDLPDDLATAAAAGKRLAVLWELKGCPFCHRLHHETLANPEVERFVRAGFEVVQLDVIGARPVTAVDGTRLPEKALAQRDGVAGTPVMQVFEGGAETARLTGFLPPADFLAKLRAIRS